MRQLVNFMDKIHVRNTKKEYYRSAFLAKLHRAEIVPLEEILGVSFEEKAFDEKTDTDMERYALAQLAQKKAMRNV